MTSQVERIFAGSRVSFTAPITALGSDLNLFNAVVNLTGQPFSLATLEMTDASTLNGAGAASLTVTGAMTWQWGARAASERW